MRQNRWLCPVLLLVASLSPTAMYGQWINYPEAGMPRTRNGKVDLAAPAPRTADGKPDLSGVWFHEKTSVAEMKRLYGPMIDDEIKVDVPGMEIGTQHKYAFNILDIEMTFDDPEMYTKPFTIKIPHDLLPDSDIFEMFCNENEKDREHLKKK